jgi:hypothetical protein
MEERSRPFDDAFDVGAHPVEVAVSSGLPGEFHMASGVEAVVVPIDLRGGDTEISAEIFRHAFRIDLTAFMPPEMQQSRLIVPHDCLGIPPVDERFVP